MQVNSIGLTTSVFVFAKQRTMRLGAALLGLFLLCGPQAAFAQTDTYNYTGAEQTWIVPPGVTSIEISASGASGGSGGSAINAGGLGGLAAGRLAVTPGSAVYIYVGGQGQTRNDVSITTLGGFNGGGNGGFDNSGQIQNGGGGGGASDVRYGAAGLADRVIVAGGGGGGGGGVFTTPVGGAGGGGTGGDGVAGNSSFSTGGTGGTQSAGGVAGTTARGATDGTLGTGGLGSTNQNAWGSGGGGGGYFGGGGGTGLTNHGNGFAAGGGGGSSYVDGVTNGTTTSGVRTGDGIVTITYFKPNDPAYSISIVQTGLPLGGNFIGDPATRSLYLAGQSTSPCPLYKLDSSAVLSTVVDDFTLGGAGGLFYPFIATDIEYYKGAVYCVLGTQGASTPTLVVVDLPSRTVSPLIQIPAADVEAGLAFDNGKLYITCGSTIAQPLFEYDIVTGTLIPITPNLPIGATGAAIHPATRMLYFAANGSIYKVDLNNPAAGHSLVASTSTGSGNMTVDPTGQFVFIYRVGGNVDRVRISDGSVFNLISGLINFPYTDVCFSRSSVGAGSSLYVRNEGMILEVVPPLAFETDAENNSGFAVPPLSANLLATATLTAVPANPGGQDGTSIDWRVLVDGSFGIVNDVDKTIANATSAGDSLTYVLDTSLPANAGGYNLTSIDSFTGWGDRNRVNQDYTASYATIDAPNTFIDFATVAYHPANTCSHVHLEVAIANVKAIRFTFADQQNGYVGYHELAAAGTPIWAPTAVANNTGFTVPPLAENLLATATLTANPATAAGEEGTSTDWNVLVDASFGTVNDVDGTMAVVSNAGTTLTYTLDTSLPINAAGFNLTSIDSFTGWRDSGRVFQDYTVSYATVANPARFINIAQVAFHPDNNASWVHLDVTLANVKAIRFIFAEQQNGFVGYRELAAAGFGAAVPTVAAVASTSITFNGGNVIDIPAYPGVNLTDASFSWEFWARKDPTVASGWVLGDGTSGNTNQSLHIGFRDNNYFSFAFWGNDLEVPGLPDLTRAWHHYAGTYDASTNARSFYLDGVLRGSDVASADYSGPGLRQIGYGGGGPFYAGQLDDVRIWNGTVLTQQQIQTRLNSRLNGNEAGLTGLWRFDEGSSAGPLHVNSGVDAGGNVLPDSAIDPDFTIVGAGPAVVHRSDIFPIVDGTWVFNSSISKWIAPEADTAISPGGQYTYRTTFDLGGRDPSRVRIFGNWATDNAGDDILINGVSTGNTSPDFTALRPFTISTGFVSGVNTIDFKVTNSDTGFTGLRVEMQVVGNAINSAAAGAGFDGMLQANLEYSNLSPVPDNKNAVTTAEDTELKFALAGSAPYSLIPDITIRSLPTNGSLKQNDGTPITVVPAKVTDVDRFVRYTPNLNVTGVDVDSFKISAINNPPPGDSPSATVTITVTPVNDPPTDIALSGSSVAENSAVGTTVGTFSATDPDAVEKFAFSLAVGAGDDDNAAFTITGGELKTAAIFDFEGKNGYSIRVRATDIGGLTFEKIFTVTVTGVNEAPTDIALGGTTVAENSVSGTTVGTLSATDVDAADTAAFSLVSGAGGDDNASFTIDGTELKTAAVFDFETKSSYSIRVRVTDSGSLTFEEAFTITVSDENDAPTDIALSVSGVAENRGSGTTVGTFSATDADAGDTAAFSLVSGAGDGDNASFTIDGAELKTAAVFDYETKSVYSIRVRATDSGSATYEEVFIIDLIDENDIPTDIALSGSSVAENSASGTAVGTFSATDADAVDTAVFSLISGIGSGDNASFTITGTELKTAAVFDFETKNSYSIRVSVTDSKSGTYEEAFTITVANVNEAPVITSTPTATPASVFVFSSVAFAVSATDPDGNTLTFTWDFKDGTTGTGASTTHIFSAAGTYNVEVSVSDGTIAATANVSVEVKPAVSAPVKKGAVKFTFNVQNKDALTLSGTVPLPVGFVINGKTLDILIESYVVNGLVFNSKNTAVKDKKVSFKLAGKIDKKTGQMTVAGATYTLSVKDTLFDSLKSAGFVNDDVTITVPLTSIFRIDGVPYTAQKTFAYKAKKNKTGAGK